jgi:hypothetical protein
VEKEEEALAEEVDNIIETIPPGFTPMPRYKKSRLNPPSSNTIMENEDESSLEWMTRREATMMMVGAATSISRCS